MKDVSTPTTYAAGGICLRDSSQLIAAYPNNVSPVLQFDDLLSKQLEAPRFIASHEPFNAASEESVIHFYFGSDSQRKS